MGDLYLARKPQTLAGVEYRAGDELPAAAVEHPSGLGATRMERLGLLRVVPADAASADTAELDQVRADRKHVKRLLVEATDRIVELERQLAEAREELEARPAPTPITKPVDPSAPAPAPEPPPQGGAGSEVAAWRDYAAAIGVTVPKDANRGDIIDTIEAAGLPT